MMYLWVHCLLPGVGNASPFFGGVRGTPRNSSACKQQQGLYTNYCCNPYGKAAPITPKLPYAEKKHPLLFVTPRFDQVVPRPVDSIWLFLISSNASCVSDVHSNGVSFLNKFVKGSARFAKFLIYLL
ncbi:hypothetical protein TNCV_2525471 [Trichonephila clavipes]|nr:hypothetical protein TNCV_2525471 [Trichonephila clavipes]